MSDNTTEKPISMSKEEAEEKLSKSELTCDTYQAFYINKLLSGTGFRLDLFEQSKRKVTSSSKTSKKKNSKTSKPPEFLQVGAPVMEDTDPAAPGSLSSLQDGDAAFSEENGLMRRTSRRERKPATKPDLGYEEPKPIKGVKLSGASREIFRKCEEILNNLKDNFSRAPELANRAIKFEQEISNLREGKYRDTTLLGNSIRKLLNGILALFQGGTVSNKLIELINKFEESFASLDNKILFEETKMDSYIARKKSGTFGGKKKMFKANSRSGSEFDRAMSSEEKKNLSRNIRNLTAEQLKGIISIVKDMFPERDGMLEFDIDILPPHKCRELEEYVRRVRGMPSKARVSPPSAMMRQKSSGALAPDLGRKKESLGSLMGNNYPMGGNLSNPSSDSDSESSNSSMGGGLEAHN